MADGLREVNPGWKKVCPFNSNWGEQYLASDPTGMGDVTGWVGGGGEDQPQRGGWAPMQQVTALAW